MSTAQTLDDAFKFGLITFRELTVLQVLRSFLWYPDSTVFPSLKSVSQALAEKRPKDKPEPSRGWGDSIRNIRKCLQRLEERFGFAFRQYRFTRRRSFRRQTSNVYDVPGLLDVLERELAPLRAAQRWGSMAVGTPLPEAPIEAEVSGGLTGVMTAHGTKNLETTDLNSDNNTISAPSSESSPQAVVVNIPVQNSPSQKPLHEELTEHGTSVFFAWMLVKRYSADTIRIAIRALEQEQRERVQKRREPIKQPGKWLYRAVTQGWKLELEEEPVPAPPEPVDPKVKDLQGRALAAREKTSSTMREEREGAWRSVLEGLKEKLNAESFRTWFGPTRYVGSDGENDYIEVPNRIFREWIGEEFEGKVKEAAREKMKPVFVEMP